MTKITLPHFEFTLDGEGNWLAKARSFLRFKSVHAERPPLPVVEELEARYEKEFAQSLKHGMDDVRRYLHV